MEVPCQCRRCKQWKLASEFYTVLTKKGVRYRRKVCKICVRVDTEISRFRRDYNCTPEDIRALVVVQCGRCAICGNAGFGTMNGRTKNSPLADEMSGLVVDHDHRTQKVRAMLCGNCNTMLGHAKEQSGLLRKAAEYLDHHNKKEGYSN